MAMDSWGEIAVDVSVQAALKRIEQLKAEIAVLERFVSAAAEAEEVLARAPKTVSLKEIEARGYDRMPGAIAPGTAGIMTGDGKIHTANEFKTVARRPRATGNPPPDKLIPAAKEVILERGFPLSRRAIHEGLAKRGLVVHGTDPLKTLGTILWRAQDEIQSIEGRGYWPKEWPAPPESNAEIAERLSARQRGVKDAVEDLLYQSDA